MSGKLVVRTDSQSVYLTHESKQGKKKDLARFRLGRGTLGTLDLAKVVHQISEIEFRETYQPATPAARELAEEEGVSLESIEGTGEEVDGVRRVLKGDVEKYIEEGE